MGSILTCVCEDIGDAGSVSGRHHSVEIGHVSETMHRIVVEAVKERTTRGISRSRRTCQPRKQARYNTFPLKELLPVKRTSILFRPLFRVQPLADTCFSDYMAAWQPDGLFSLRWEGFAAVAVGDGADEAVLLVWGEVGAVDGLEAGREEHFFGRESLPGFGHSVVSECFDYGFLGRS